MERARRIDVSRYESFETIRNYTFKNTPSLDETKVQSFSVNSPFVGGDRSLIACPIK